MASTYTLDDPRIYTRFTERSAATCSTYFTPLLKPTDVLLDLGCGPGSITTDLARIVSSVIGFDASSGSLEMASQRARSLGLSNVEFREGNVAERLPFADETFDVVHTHMLLVHLPDPVTTLREAWRVLKKGGFLASREGSMANYTVFPENETIREMFVAGSRRLRATGADPELGMKLKATAVKAGFAEDQIKESWSEMVQLSKGKLPSGEDDYIEGIKALARKTGALNDDQLEAIGKAWMQWELTEGAYSKFHVGEVICTK